MLLLETTLPTKERAEDLDPDYYNRLVMIGDELENIIELDEKHLEYGPVYEVTTSAGQKLEVITVCHDGKTATGLKCRKWYLVAIDDQGHVVADRHTTLTFREWEGEKFATAEGMIATGIRGKGLALPLEKVHLDVLQREANRKTNGIDRITWHISNHHNELLVEAKDEYKKDENPDLLPKLNQMIEEQKRWQAIYGPDGKLGFKTGWNKDFRPNGGDGRIHEIASITEGEGNQLQVTEASEHTTQRKKEILTALIKQMVE